MVKKVTKRKAVKKVVVRSRATPTRFLAVMVPVGVFALAISFAASLWWSSPLVASADIGDFFYNQCHDHLDNNGGGGIDLLDSFCNGVENDAPEAYDQHLFTIEGAATTTTLTGNDEDGANGDLLYFSISMLPANGTLTCAGGACTLYSVFGSTISGGTAPSVTYTPDVGFSGTDEFDFTASDGREENDATVIITVHAVASPANSAPTAEAQNVSLDENTSKAITLEATDSDAGDTLVFATTSNPAHGTLTGSGVSYTYTPAPDYVGSDSFNFSAGDGLATSTATVSITVNDVVVPPPSGGGNTQNNNNGGGGVVLGLIGQVYVNPSSGGQVLGTTTAATDEEVLPAGCTAYLGSYLKMGDGNDSEQVKKLQTFLNKHIGVGIPVTGVFGPMTFDAVQKFQLVHWESVLKPWVAFGLPNEKTPTGYVYKTTKHKINLMNCASLKEPAPQLP